MPTSSASATAPFALSPGILPESPAPAVASLDPATDNIGHLLQGEVHQQVLAMTRALFPGEVSSRVDEDPEFPSYQYSVITAQASGEPADIVAREIEWHRQITGQFPQLAPLRLSLAVQ
jgi:hypothetical protein